MSKISIQPLRKQLVDDREYTAVARSGYARYFFPVMAVLFPILALLGFGPSYQAMAAGTMTVHWFVHVHGALMTGWLLVFWVQTMLVATDKRRFHRQLGLFSMVLGVLVWISMGIVSYRVLIGFPPHLDNIPWAALWLQMSAMNLFGWFFAWAMLVRKKDTAAHQRLLLLATLVLIQSAVGRLQWLPWYNAEHPNVFFLYVDALLIPLFIYDFVTIKRVHKVTWIGSACLMVAQWIVTML